MQNIIEDYSQYREKDKMLFKEFLNEILLIEKTIKKDKDKKAINQKEIDKDNDEILKKWIKLLEDEWINEDDVKNIDENSFFKDIFWIEDRSKESIINFPVYKWNIENNANDNLYMNRIIILNYLKDNWIIRVSDFNVFKEIENVTSTKDEFMSKLFLEQKEKLIEKYWEKIAERQLEWLKGKERYLQMLIFEKKDITKLLHLIKESEIKEFKFRNSTIFYWDKVAYVPPKDSFILDFINLFYKEKADKYYTIIEVYSYIEWLYWDMELNEKQRKQIYNVKDKLNKKIEQKTWIKDLFSFWKWEHKGEIYLKY